MTKKYIEDTYLPHTCKYSKHLPDDEYSVNNFEDVVDIKCYKNASKQLSVNDGYLGITIGGGYYIVAEKVSIGDKLDGKLIEDVIPYPLGFGAKLDCIYKVSFGG